MIAIAATVGVTPRQVRAESFASMIAFTEGLTGKAQPEGDYMSIERFRELKAEVSKYGEH